MPDRSEVWVTCIHQESDTTTTLPSLRRDFHFDYLNLNYVSSPFLDWYFHLVFSLYMWFCYFSQRRPVDYRNPALWF